MRQVSRWVVVAWSFASMCACATLTGLDSLQKDLDAGADVTADSPADHALDVSDDTRSEASDGPSKDDSIADVQSESCSGSVQHDDGIGQTFCDSVPSGTIDQQLALDACKAFTGDVSLCGSGHCGLGDAANGDLVVCATQSPTDCPCWTYQGPDMGYVHDPHAASMCICSNGVGDPKFH